MSISASTGSVRLRGTEKATRTSRSRIRPEPSTVRSGIPEPAGIEDFKPLDYVYITGEVTSFNNSLQLNIKRARPASPNEYKASDYLPVSEKDPEQMYQKFMASLEGVKNPWLKQLIAKYFGDENFKAAFMKHSAAKSVHHGFVGGLLEHTLSVVTMCEFFCTQYPYLNHDLLITAAAFHDVGKLKEISSFPENDYTDDGQLLGHIVMGSELVGYGCRTIKGFPHRLQSEPAALHPRPSRRA